MFFFLPHQAQDKSEKLSNYMKIIYMLDYYRFREQVEEEIKLESSGRIL